MAALPSSLSSSGLSIEPVIGWRAWGLRWDGRDRVELVSPIQSFRWPARQPSRARCVSHFGKQLPYPYCTCGLYAVTRLDRLPSAGGLAGSTPVAVVGSVAMWGRVVEHTYGYRGQLAYPDRLRLVCSRCLRAGFEGVPTRVQRTSRGELEPVCRTHTTNPPSSGPEITIERLQRMVLDAYAVDLLPIEALHEAGLWPGRVTPPGLGAAARHETRELLRGRNAVLAVVLSIAAVVVLGVLGVFGSPPPPRAVAPADDGAITADVPVVEPVDPPADDLAHVGSDESGPRLRFGAVCGHRVGDVVQVMPCWRPTAELLGMWVSPPDSRRACGPYAYSRRGTFSVCWLDLDSEAEWEILRMPGVRRWDLRS